MKKSQKRERNSQFITLFVVLLSRYARAVSHDDKKECHVISLIQCHTALNMHCRATVLLYAAASTKVFIDSPRCDTYTYTYACAPLSNYVLTFLFLPFARFFEEKKPHNATLIVTWKRTE